MRRTLHTWAVVMSQQLGRDEQTEDRFKNSIQKIRGLEQPAFLIKKGACCKLKNRFGMIPGRNIKAHEIQVIEGSSTFCGFI